MALSVLPSTQSSVRDLRLTGNGSGRGRKPEVSVAQQALEEGDWLELELSRQGPRQVTAKSIFSWQMYFLVR